jgi:dienelactone hydrolase
MCLGGHLAYRCALDSRIKAAVCYFATDIHSKTLALGKNDDSLARAGDIKGELLMVSLFSLWLMLSLALGIVND